MRAHLLYFHSWVSWSNLSHNQSKNYKVFPIRKYHQIFVWQISLHEDLFFQKNNFFTKLFFLANFFNKYFYNKQKTFFAKKTFRQRLKIYEIFSSFKKHHCAKKFFRNWKILKNSKKLFYQKNIKKLFWEKILKNLKKWFCKNFFRN